MSEQGPQDELMAALTRIEAKLTLLAKATVHPLLDRELTDKKKRKLYDVTGEARRADIARKLRMSSKTITAAWKRWHSQGLLTKHGRNYRKVL